MSGPGNGARFGAFDGTDLVAEATGPVEWIALEGLVERVYRIHSRRVLERSGWRCSRCRRSGRLHIHHRRYRSHARDREPGGGVLGVPSTDSPGRTIAVKNPDSVMRCDTLKGRQGDEDLQLQNRGRT